MVVPQAVCLLTRPHKHTSFLQKAPHGPIGPENIQIWFTDGPRNNIFLWITKKSLNHKPKSPAIINRRAPQSFLCLLSEGPSAIILKTYYRRAPQSFLSFLPKGPSSFFILLPKGHATILFYYRRAPQSFLILLQKDPAIIFFSLPKGPAIILMLITEGPHNHSFFYYRRAPQ